MRTFGCLGSAFPCHTFGPFHELCFAQSCSHVYPAQQECKRHNPLYEYAIYDGCHQDELCDSHPCHEFLAPSAFCRVRKKCHTLLSPYLNPALTRTVVLPVPLSPAPCTWIDEGASGEHSAFRESMLPLAHVCVRWETRIASAYCNSCVAASGFWLSATSKIPMQPWQWCLPRKSDCNYASVLLENWR